MSDAKNDFGRKIRRELIVLGGFLIAGLTVLPAVVYAVGTVIFGEYPNGLAGFYGEIWGGLVTAGPGTWFLVVSPYLVWLTMRLTWRGVRGPRSRSRPSERQPEPKV